MNDILVSILRGGTSKGLFFLKDNLPKTQEETDNMLLKVMGSPDAKQINGLGGATSVTSKVAIISKSDREDADVNYTFAQVSVDKAIVSYKGNCGNISSGVAPFAIEKGLVEITDKITAVRIYNTNTDKIIISEVEIENGKVKYDGDFAIAGVPSTASPVKLRFVDPKGSVTGKLLPTGNAVDVLNVEGVGEVKASIVDAANPLVFITAESIGLNGEELPKDIDSNEDLLNLIEKIRGVAAVKLGFIDDYKDSATKSPTIPKMTIVTKAKSYTTSSNKNINSQDIDLISKMMSMQKTHPSYAMTGAMCTVAAAVIKGSIVNEVMDKNFNPAFVKIGHPSGILEAGVDFTIENNETIVNETFGFRTARLLMDGKAFY